jgi:hypothetical protein
VDDTRGRRDGRDQQAAEAVFRVRLRPIASSLPLGSFALTGAYQVTASVPVERAAGWPGIPIAVFALSGGRRQL